MCRFKIAACLLAVLSLAACGSGASDNTTSTGSGGSGTNPVLVPEPFATPDVTPQDGTGLIMTARELAFASYLFEEINLYRFDNNLAEVDWDVNVAAVAVEHSVDMKSTGILTHDGPSPCVFPADCLGMRLLSGSILYTSAGENVARGFEDPDQLLEAWKLSPTHNEILLDPQWQHMGIAYLEGPAPTNPAATGPWVTLNCIDR
jgi:uncharacterized protein YkwD